MTEKEKEYQLRYRNKPGNREKQAEYAKRYREKNREKCAENSRIYYQNHKEQYAEYARNRDKESRSEYMKKYAEENRERLREYSKKWYRENTREQRIAFQEEMARSARPDKCEICGRSNDPDKYGHRTFWDHDHTTGKFRGWLCREHNIIIGIAHDEPEFLEQAAKYLREKSNGIHPG